jgi:fatty-acyl-CoA synthase
MTPATPEWAFTDVIDVVAAAVPDREAVVWTTVRRTHAELQVRTRALAAFFGNRGLGAHRERHALERWETGQSGVATVMSNCPEYVETMVAAYRARAVPVNVNHHYHAREVADLIGRMHVEAIVYHRRLAPLLEQGIDLPGRILVHVEDGSDTDPLPGSVAFDDALAEGAARPALPTPSPDDLYLVCTGGTTGPPKGVMWRQGDAFVSAVGGAEGMTAAMLVERTKQPARLFATSPLMHSAGQRTTMTALFSGGTAILHDDARPFDARTILQTAACERVNMLAIVGDAYARPIVDELRAGSYDLSALRLIGTGGATTSAAVKAELLELLPHVTISDSYSSSETGRMAAAAATADDQPARFSLAPDAGVLSDDRTRFLEPGEDEVGWTARRGRVPLGYLDDRDATERVFPGIGGERLSVPGDRARLTADGTIEFLGRDSMVVNSGGEKVFVEEVEEAIRRHPDVLDALVVGRPHERFGQEVVALVQLRPGVTMTPADVREYAAETIARFKAPRAVAFCEVIGRNPSGKPDYKWARAAAADARSATTP